MTHTPSENEGGVPVSAELDKVLYCDLECSPLNILRAAANKIVDEAEFELSEIQFRAGCSGPDNGCNMEIECIAYDLQDEAYEVEVNIRQDENAVTARYN